MGHAARIGTVALALLALLGGYFAGQQLRHRDGAGVPSGIPSVLDLVNQQAAAVIGSRRPDVTLQDLSGRSRSIAEWDGSLVVVNFWATWCPPCLNEIPIFVRLQERFASEGVQFLGIAMDGAKNIERFLAEQPLNYPTLLGEQDVMQAATAFGNSTGALPYTAVIAPNGIVVQVHAGELSEAQATAIIKGELDKTVAAAVEAIATFYRIVQSASKFNRSSAIVLASGRN